MIPEPALERAVAVGLITSAQADGLRSLAREMAEAAPPTRRSAEPVDEERLRFVTGFADIFVTLGLALFFGSAAYLIGRVLSESLTAAAIAVMAWGLAEFFTRRRRMALPSISLLVVFAFASFLALGLALGGPSGGRSPVFGWLGSLIGPRGDPLPAALAGLGTAVLTAAHYWRFRVPITVAAGVAALATTALSLLFAASPDVTMQGINPILFGLGLIIFALAMRFDLSDPGRVTRRTDIAFWLHLLASPLIVHSVFQQIGAGRGLVSPGVALGIIAIFLVLAAVAVLVDRRAMLVSGLVYAGVASVSLIRQVGITDTGLPVTLLILGIFVLVLSAGWTPLRALILAGLPQAFADRLPHPVRT